MKKFLVSLYLIVATFLPGMQQVSAQSAILNAPSDVCNGSFATMNAHLTSGTAAKNPTIIWTVTKKNAGTTTTSLYGTFDGNTAASSNSDNSTVSVQFNAVDEVTFTVKVPYSKGSLIDTITITKTIIVHDCTPDVCYGTDNAGTGFTETFGSYTDGLRHTVQAPATVNYIFQSGVDGSFSPQVEDNFYCVTTSTQQHDGWIKSPDHTNGDFKGAMLVCNSQNKGLAFYTRTITGLCQGAKYNFSAYFMNLNTQAILEGTCAGGYVYAGVDFQIIDAKTKALLATFPTYDVSMGIPNSTWNRYGGTFKTPANVDSVIFQMVNRNPGGCGNDIAVDDIDFSYCGPRMFTYIDGLKGNVSNSICQNQSVSLTGSVTPGDYFSNPVYYWQDSIAGNAGWQNIVLDSINFIKTNDSTITVSGDVLKANGNNSLEYFFRVKVVEKDQDPDGTCARFSDPARILVLPVPLIELDNPRICIGDEVKLATQNLYPHYKWTIKSTPVRIIEGDTSQGIFNTITDKPQTTTQYIVEGTVKFGKSKSCSRQDTTTVLVDTLPVGNLVPQVAYICVNTPITLQANPSSDKYRIRWSTGLLQDTTASITVQHATIGQYFYSDTLINGMCKIHQDDTLNVQPLPVASVAKDVLMECSKGTFTLNGNIPGANQVGTWTVQNPANGATIATTDIHKPDAILTGLTLGTNVTVIWDIRDTLSVTSCNSAAKVTLWNLPMPTTGKIAQTVLTNCSGTFNLTANDPAAGEVGTWTIVSNTRGGATGVTILNKNAPATTVTLSGAKPQTVVLAWTLNNGTCDGTAAQVTLNYVAPPTISIDSVAPVCASDGAFNLVINNFTGSPTRISLTSNVPGFAAWDKTAVNFTQPLNITLPVKIPAGTPANKYNFSLIVSNDSAACTSTPISFTVTVKTPSTAPTGASASPAEICMSGTTILTVSGGSLGTDAQWKWYAGSCGGTVIGTGSPLSVPVNTTTTFYVRAEDLTSTCGVTACADTKVTVFADATPAKAGPDQEHCNDANFKMAADTVISGKGTWTVVSGSPVIDKPTSPTSWVNVAPGTTATLLWTVNNGPCAGGADQVVLINRASIANNLISANQKICQGSNANPIVGVGALSGGAGTYTYRWQSAPKSNGTFTNISGATTAAYNPGALTDSVFYRRIVTSGACTDTSNIIRVIVVNKDPYIKSPLPDLEIECDKNLEYTSAFTKPDFVDPYDTPLKITFVDKTTGSCPQVITRTWTATDSCGRKVTATQTLTIRDITPPVFDNKPADITVECNAIPAPAKVTATDNCSMATVTLDSTHVDVPGTSCPNSNYKILYTWTAEDGCGNKATYTQTVTVQDKTAPRFVTPAPANVTVECDKIPAQAALTVADNCTPTGNITVIQTVTTDTLPNACANNYVITYTWIAIDQCGNKDSVKQKITVRDMTAPSFTTTTPADVNVSCEAVPDQIDLDVKDNCSPTDSIKVVKSASRQQVKGACSGNYVLTYTWTATDQCGNSTSVSQHITVSDQTAPTFITPVPPAITASCDAIPVQIDLDVKDNCSPRDSITIVKSTSVADGRCANERVITYTWTATDLCGNSTTVSQKVTLQDKTPPKFTKPAPADVTVLCNQVPPQIDLTYADNCSATDKIQYIKQAVKTASAGTCVNAYTLRYTWIITDECGNVDSTHQLIQVVDTVPPVFTATAPQDITVSCNKVPAQPTFYAKDACDPDLITAVADERREDIPGACVNNYRLIRTWTAYDGCGNKATLTQIVTVVDNIKPTFPDGKPANVTVECNAIPVQQPVAVADNCSAPDKIAETMYTWKELIPGACANNYKLHYTWVAQDECGNVDSVSQVITVQNTQPPTFDIPMPRDTTVSCEVTVPWPAVTATSACGAKGNVKVTTSKTTKTSGACNKAYTETRTWTATDECGNTATWKQVINVEDTTRPVFTMKIPHDTTVECNAVPAAPQLSGYDNCSTGMDLSGAYKVKVVAGNCPQSYQLIRTWTLKDACGNTNTAMQTITVKDMTAPVIAPAPADITLYCQDPVPAHVILKATDNCDPTFPKNATYTEDPYVKDICAGYTITRRWSAVDACGNVAQQVIQHVIIKPCSKPALADSLPITCSSNPYITLGTKGTVNKPTYTLTAVEPAGVVKIPVSQAYNVFNVKGATSATFIVTDGITGCVSDPKTYTLRYNASPVVNLGRDTAICGGNSLVLDAGAANFNYNIVWSTGEKTQRINVTRAGTYWVTVTNASCVVTDTIRVALIPTPLVDIPDTTICRGQTVKLDAYVNGAAYLWSNGTTNASIITGAQDQYWVKVSKNGCITIDTVNVTVNPPPDIQLRRDTAICPGQSVMLTVSADGGRIRWLNGSTQPNIVVAKPGSYWVTVTKNNCVVRDTVNVREQPKLKLDLGTDQDLCPGSQITLDATSAGAISYLWNDGDPNPVKTITEAGFYKVAVMDQFCQMVHFDSVRVNMSNIPVVSLGNDTIMCNGETLNLTPKGSNIRSVRWSDGSTGSTLQVTKPGTYTVTAFNDCGSSTDQITVSFQDCVPDPTFPNAFSPNGDGKNDFFQPTVRGPMYNYELRIFNRWGQLIFLGSDAKKGWDGTFNGQPVDIGTYVYWMTYKASPAGTANIIKGSVALIR